MLCLVQRIAWQNISTVCRLLHACLQYDPQAKLYTMTARRNIAKGEVLYDSYGPKANDELLPVYGFFLENNPYNKVPLFDSIPQVIEWFIQYATAHVPRPLRNVGVSELERFVDIAKKVEETVTWVFDASASDKRFDFLRDLWRDREDAVQSAWAGHRVQQSLIAVLATLFRKYSAPGIPRPSSIAARLQALALLTPAYH